MKAPKIIAFLANKRCGKTTLTNALLEEGNYEKLFFAEPVYSITNSITSCLESALEEVLASDDATQNQRDNALGLIKFVKMMELDEYKYLKRGILQGVGDGCRNTIHPNLWLDMLVGKVLSSDPESKTTYVVDDCRYLNEMITLKKLGAKLVHITKDGSDGLHPSEHVEQNVKLLQEEYGVTPDLTINYADGEENAISAILTYVNSDDYTN